MIKCYFYSFSSVYKYDALYLIFRYSYDEVFNFIFNFSQ